MVCHHAKTNNADPKMGLSPETLFLAPAIAPNKPLEYLDKALCGDALNFPRLADFDFVNNHPHDLHPTKMSHRQAFDLMPSATKPDAADEALESPK